MPATRSRTANWHHSLVQLHERNGALEISLPAFADAAGANSEESAHGRNLIWRVRIIDLTDDAIVVELPSALGQEIRFQDGVELIGIVAIGQNRWMFKTSVLGSVNARLNGSHTIHAMRLAMPDKVERCQRRQFYRVSTVGLTLPEVECYPLLDPLSVVVAEAANRLEIQRLTEDCISGRITPDAPDFDTKPQIGPLAKALLVNIGGGGSGLLFESDNRMLFERHRAFWLRVNLMPHIPAPICISARLRHTHIDSAQRIYAGMAFEFGHSPEHQKFIVDQICRYATLLQREQLRRASKR